MSSNNLSQNLNDTANKRHKKYSSQIIDKSRLKDMQEKSQFVAKQIHNHELSQT